MNENLVFRSCGHWPENVDGCETCESRNENTRRLNEALARNGIPAQIVIPPPIKCEDSASWRPGSVSPPDKPTEISQLIKWLRARKESIVAFLLRPWEKSLWALEDDKELRGRLRELDAILGMFEESNE